MNVDLYRRNEVLIWNINKVTLHRYEKDLVKEIPLKNLFGLEHSAIKQSCNIYWHSSHYRMSYVERNVEENVYIRLSDDGGSESRIMTGMSFPLMLYVQMVISHQPLIMVPLMVILIVI